MIIENGKIKELSVNDTVIVKSYEEILSEFKQDENGNFLCEHETFTEQMAICCNMKAVVKKVIRKNDHNLYKLSGDNIIKWELFKFDSCMLKPEEVEENE